MDHHAKLATVDAFTAQALDMISSPKALEAFDLTREPAKVREKYGKPKAAYIYSPKSDKTLSWPGERFLLALRLVEAGVPIVTLRVGRWDHHGAGVFGNIFSLLCSELPLPDTSLQALVTDLHERGLDRDVAVVVWVRMDALLRINATAGRDHWNSSGFALFAGGGLKMGQVIGATQAQGARAPHASLWRAKRAGDALSRSRHHLRRDDSQPHRPPHIPARRPVRLIAELL